MEGEIDKLKEVKKQEEKWRKKKEKMRECIKGLEKRMEELEVAGGRIGGNGFKGG